FGAAFGVPFAGEERLVVLQEVERGRGDLDLPGLLAAIRRAIADEHQVQAHAVALVRAHSLPRTTSGKVRRGACRDLYLAGQLALLAESTLPAEPDSVGEPGPDRGGPAEERLLEVLARASRLRPDELDPEQRLGDLGLDSLGVLQVQHALEECG